MTLENVVTYDPIRSEIQSKGVLSMLTIDTFVAILGLCITSFGLGYTLGSKEHKK